MAKNARKELDSLKLGVQQKFAELRAALHMREKLLMRQIDVIATSQQQIGRGTASSNAITCRADESSITTDEREMKFLAEEEELLAAIRSFGRFQLDNMNLTLQDVYLKNEDYITPSNDHETMYKCLNQPVNTADMLEEEDEQKEAIVVDFSRNKSLIEHNTRHMNESIINITLQEAKELIKKAKIRRETPIPPLNLEELDDELESSIAEAVHSLGRESPINTKSSQTKLKKNRFKPKITINNCNGTINLRNISSLTINCATEEAVNAEIPFQTETQDNVEEEDTSTQYSKYSNNTQKAQTSIITVESSSTENNTPITTASSSNYSSNSSSRSQSKKQKNYKKIQNKKNTRTTDTTTAITTGTTQPTSTTYPYEIDDDEPNDVTCDFYNRLLNEIKNTLTEKSKRTLDNTHYLFSGTGGVGGGQKQTTDDSTCDTNSNSCSGSTAISREQQQQQPPPGKRLVLKNFENLKIILEANSDEETFHPVQIEQWLAEIISETDLEPMQNTDILEHSKIHNEST